jgi:hypothetical protein
MPSDVPGIQAWLSPDVGVTIRAKSDCVAPGFPSPRLQIEFSANLPWVLAESPDDAEIE